MLSSDYSVSHAEGIDENANIIGYAYYIPTGSYHAILWTVEDREAPLVTCRPAPNPSGKKIPVAGKNPQSGQNPDGFYQLLAKDNCDPDPKIFIADSASSFVAGPFASGDIVKITQSHKPGSQPAPGRAFCARAEPRTAGVQVCVTRLPEPHLPENPPATEVLTPYLQRQPSDLLHLKNAS